MNLNDAVVERQGQGPGPKDPLKSQGEGNGQQVPPEIQEQFDIFVANGMSIIHSQKASDGILAKILKAENRIKGLAEALVGIVGRLADSLAGAGQKMANETLIHGSNVLLGELITMAEAAGMQKLTDEQKTEAFQWATGMYLEESVKTGRMTKDQIMAMGQEAKQGPGGQQIEQQMQGGA